MPVETIERAKLSATPIVCLAKMSDGSLKFNGTVGSAFFVNDEGYFVTAAHVIDGLENRQKTDGGNCISPAIYLPVTKWDDRSPVGNYLWFSFVNCLKNDPDDVAVCRPNENPFRNPEVKNHVRFVTFATSSRQADGTAVAFTGFPLNFTKPVTSKAYIASFLPDVRFIMIDKTAWPGASGCPLYLTDGAVIGVIVRRGLNDASGLAYARPVEVVTDFLIKSKITFHQQK